MKRLNDCTPEDWTNALYSLTDNVKNPKHYGILDTEVIELIRLSLSKEEFRGYCLGNIMKYRLRAGKKDDAQQDLEKANEYERIWGKYYENKGND